MRESDIEAHLAARVKALGGEVRKVVWVGRQGAPDRLVMLPEVPPRQGGLIDNGDGTCTVQMLRLRKPGRTLWVELKNPDTIRTFPANPHERKQHREHERMRAMGQRVEVIGTIEQVEELLR